MIGEGELAGMLEMTRSLRKGFAGTAPRRWDAATAGAELTVQLGHVAMCLARRHGIDVSAFADPGRPITDAGDELADVALALLSIGVLSDGPPSLVPSGPAGAAVSEIEALLVLLICAGQAAEAGLVRTGYRHQPTGSPAPVPQACGTALHATDHRPGSSTWISPGSSQRCIGTRSDSCPPIRAEISHDAASTLW